MPFLVSICKKEFSYEKLAGVFSFVKPSLKSKLVEKTKLSVVGGLGGNKVKVKVKVKVEVEVEVEAKVKVKVKTKL